MTGEQTSNSSPQESTASFTWSTYGINKPAEFDMHWGNLLVAYRHELGEKLTEDLQMEVKVTAVALIDNLAGIRRDRNKKPVPIPEIPEHLKYQVSTGAYSEWESSISVPGDPGRALNSLQRVFKMDKLEKDWRTFVLVYAYEVLRGSEEEGKRKGLGREFALIAFDAWGIDVKELVEQYSSHVDRLS